MHIAKTFREDLETVTTTQPDTEPTNVGVQDLRWSTRASGERPFLDPGETRNLGPAPHCLTLVGRGAKKIFFAVPF